MIQFIPVKEFRGLLLSHALPEVTAAVCGGRMNSGGCVISIGKEHICVLSFEHGYHAGSEAGLRIAAAAAGSGISMPEREDKFVGMRAAHDGLLRIDEEALKCIHSKETVRLDCFGNHQRVVKGQVVAKMTIILELDGDDGRLREIEKICHERRPVIDVLPFRQFRVGVVVTDSRGALGRPGEKINPILKEKFMALGSSVIGQEWVYGEAAVIAAAIRRLIAVGVDMIVCAGGQASADTNDQAAIAVRASGGRFIAGPSPTLPQKRCYCAWIGAIPVLRLPGSVLHRRTSIFDLIMPRFLAGKAITEEVCMTCGRDGWRLLSP
jgi:hypothetical protein